MGDRLKIPFRRTLSQLLFAAVCLTAASALAQDASPPDPAPTDPDMQKIVALVNDDIVSAYDLNQRVNLMMAGASRSPTDQEIQTLRAQVLQNLIDEKLELQEAKKRDVKIEKKEIDDAFENFARQNNMTPKEFTAYLERGNVSVDSLRAQIGAEIAWQELVGRRLRPFANVSRDEVETTYNRLQQNASETEYLASEILLGVDTPDKDKAVRKKAEDVVKQIGRIDNFAPIARNFSEAATAKAGGDLGWVKKGQLDAPLDKSLGAMQPGQISAPIRTDSGYVILGLRDKRSMVTAAGDSSDLVLAQIFAAVPKGAAAEAAAGLEAKMKAAAAAITSCDQINAAARQIPGADSSMIGQVRMTDLPAPVQQLVKSTAPGHASAPLRSPEGLRVLVVCQRSDQPTPLPSKDDVENRLLQQKLGMMARRYLRDLRRDAIIEYR